LKWEIPAESHTEAVAKKQKGGGSIMEKEALTPANLPSWVKNLLMNAPFSMAVKGGGFVFVSGCCGFLDPKTEALVEGIEAQTRETMELVKDTLEAAGSSLDKVVKVTVSLRNDEDFPKMNEVYRTFFPKDPPARSTKVTGLVLPQMLVEIECMALV
jgi:2-iminobutanoate/2-iminopropanoate deaminase